MNRDPRVENRRTLCQRCGSRFNPDEGFTGIHSSQGRTPAEQIRHGRVFFLCAECSASLRAWLKLAPADDRSRE